MPSVTDQAIVLTRLDYSETSQILVVLTRNHGKVRAIAKGIKRGTRTRFVTGADLLDIGVIVVVSREERSPGLATLTEWKHTRSLLGLREKLSRIYAGQYCAEITAHLTEDWDPHVDVFDALHDTLVDLADADAVIGLVVGYQRALLEAIGSLPRFDICLGCGRSDAMTHFSSHEGGVICRHCEPGHVEKRALSPATLNVLRSLVAGGVAAVDPQDDAHVIGAFDILDYHLAHLMGRPAALADRVVPSAKRRRLDRNDPAVGT